MHLISHFGSAFCVGSLLSPYSTKFGTFSRFSFPAIVATGALLPDIDGISVLFNHRVYYGTYWYSHHGAVHSLSGILFLSITFALVISVLSTRSLQFQLRRLGIIIASLYLGSIIHLIEDIPCPPGPWGGLMLFWPLSCHRFGGWSHIWWVNEYLIAVSFFGALSIFVIMLIFRYYSSIYLKRLEWALIPLSLLILLLVAKYVIVSRYVNPVQWKTYQISLLTEPPYNFIKFWNDKIQCIWVKEFL